MLKILIIEDDRNLADAVSRSLITADFIPTIAYDGNQGLEYAMNDHFDAIVLDIMLPGPNGLDICRTLKEHGSQTPIIIASAREAIEQRIEGLDAGADDYMTKPFAPSELIARINAVIRRAHPNLDSQERQRYGNLEFSSSTGEISCGSESFALSEKEATLMSALLQNPGAVCSKTELMEKIWPGDDTIDVNNVEAYVSFLRKKLSFISTNVKIKTLRKIGYRLEIRDEQQEQQ